MLPSSLHSGVLYLASHNRMFPPNLDLADRQKDDALDRWVQRQVEEAMKNFQSDLEVVPSPLLLEEMELAPAGPGSGRGAVDLFTFLSREAEKMLRRSAVLSVPQSAYDVSRLAIPCPWTGPLHRRSLPAPLVAHQGLAAKPTSSSHRMKRQRGVPSCVSAGEEYPMAAAGAVVSLTAYVRAAASRPASSFATALSARLAAPPPMPSALAPARCSGATPEELEERLRFFARQIKSFRKTSLLYFSPEQIQRIKQMEEDYETAVRLVYCCPPSPTPSHMSAAAAQPTSGLQGTAPAVEQPTSGLQSSAAAVEQPTSGLRSAAAAVEQPTSASAHATEGLCDASAPPAHTTEGLCDASAPPAHATEGLCDASAPPVHATEGLCDASAPPVQATEGLYDTSAPPAHATEGPANASAPAHVTEGPATLQLLVSRGSVGNWSSFWPLNPATRGSRRKSRQMMSLRGSKNSLSSFWTRSP
ncbi:hypothetical protein CRENBAI_017860 [Crenichthys baileyi]|uniref:Uncharacterized protein n=1 Tax=Crenichthys baileyi TaxID=28760 RepID=A0AAV9RR66_9TELE